MLSSSSSSLRAAARSSSDSSSSICAKTPGWQARRARRPSRRPAFARDPSKRCVGIPYRGGCEHTDACRGECAQADRAGSPRVGGVTSVRQP
eukprot:2353951-Prymnesium_polylepis.1